MHAVNLHLPGKYFSSVQTVWRGERCLLERGDAELGMAPHEKPGRKSGIAFKLNVGKSLLTKICLLTETVKKVN